mmetsp:Transcript_36511/g.90093  ORF Transcript_36511/g.90093 Transcript_36511/m.90093 type:complete len:205 (-) Transcript_36511:827-1441(-)
MMLVAAPVSHACATSRTGVYECEVKYSVMNPMRQPDQRPAHTQPHALMGVKLMLPAPDTRVSSKVSGRNMTARKYTTTVRMTVVMPSCVLSTVSMSFSLRTGAMVVATKEHTRHTRMPAAEMVTGNISPAHPPAESSDSELDATTRAAHVASAKDPKRSEPMPATSPTLSPTLSAMVAGLRGSSSGMPCTTLPARSAPTSAALV